MVFFMTYFSNKINPDFMACGITNINNEGICIISVDPNPVGISTELQKATVSFTICVCPSIHPAIHMEQLGSHWTDFHES
jgi:hypothetical protein